MNPKDWRDWTRATTDALGFAVVIAIWYATMWIAFATL